mmetsp:Transcript_45174/g.32990  ORF Transcript_45174/g.32990 Transcript_45174/m.32990 type:complete len:425 (-) Transcript_45174:221-1495(-)
MDGKATTFKNHVPITEKIIRREWLNKSRDLVKPRQGQNLFERRASKHVDDEKRKEELAKQRKKELMEKKQERTNKIKKDETLKTNRDQMIGNVCSIIIKHIEAAEKFIKKPTDAALIFEEKNFLRQEWYITTTSGYSSTMPLFLYVLEKIEVVVQRVQKEDLVEFMKKVMDKMQLATECIIISLIYLEKIMLKSKIEVRFCNWKPLMFTAILLASKFWEDINFWNVDYVEALDLYPLKAINQLENEFLSLCDYNLFVSAEMYTQYNMAVKELSNPVLNRLSGRTSQQRPFNRFKASPEFQTTGMYKIMMNENVQKAPSPKVSRQQTITSVAKKYLMMSNSSTQPQVSPPAQQKNQGMQNDLPVILSATENERLSSYPSITVNVGIFKNEPEYHLDLQRQEDSIIISQQEDRSRQGSYMSNKGAA